MMTRQACQHFLGTGDARGAIARVTDCGCSLAQYEWRYAQQYRAQIDQHWQEASAANPKYFDGIVLLTSVCHFEMLDTQRSRIELTLFETRFRNFLFWRHHGFTGDGAIDGFGTAIIRSSDGAFLLVRQRPGNVNEGPFNFPCGFIDRSDLDGAGRVHIASNISREIAEEVGLTAAELERRPGYLVTRVGVHLAIGVEYYSSLTSDELSTRIRNFIYAEKNLEIAEVIFVSQRQHIDGLELAPHCRQLLQELL